MTLTDGRGLRILFRKMEEDQGFETNPAAKKKEKKVADRPHVWTIELGFISPALAAVALVVSWNSLALTRQATRVAQRAYVTVGTHVISLIDRPTGRYFPADPTNGCGHRL